MIQLFMNYPLPLVGLVVTSARLLFITYLSFVFILGEWYFFFKKKIEAKFQRLASGKSAVTMTLRLLFLFLRSHDTIHLSQSELDG